MGSSGAKRLTQSRQSRPDSGLSFQVKVLYTCSVVSYSLSSGLEESLCLQPDILTETILAALRELISSEYGTRETDSGLGLQVEVLKTI